MRSLLRTVVLLALTTHGALSAEQTRPAASEKKLHGRFIHFTDAHPDPFYAAGHPVSGACHAHSGDKEPDTGKKGKNGKKKPTEDRKDMAGHWGVGQSDCDTPLSLLNITFDFLQKEWADKVDFVIWTGDNARHDIDRQYPRTPKEIYELNRMMAKKMSDTFGSKGVTVVPSMGNNDIWPHNIMEAGPSGTTNEFLSIWNDFIPDDQYHVFQRGAYFSSEVIPDKLAVISLNTLYWYDNNKAVDGCKFGSSEPGALEMDWLDVQLNSFRQRGMQVWLTGHVPPHAGNYFGDCWYRYGQLSLRYQDTIVGHTFGHMNVDHFFWIDSHTLAKYAHTLDTHSLLPSNTSLLSQHSPSFFPFSSPSSPFSPELAKDLLPFDVSPSSEAHEGRNESDKVRVMKSRTRSGTLQGDLLQDFLDLPRRKKTDLDDYTIINVSPSIIPTYFPSIRIFTYNATAEPWRAPQEPDEPWFAPTSKPGYDVGDYAEEDGEEDEVEEEREGEDDADLKKKKKKKKGGSRRPHIPGDNYCRRKKNRSKPECQPQVPRNANATSPSRTNGFGTPLGYAQFYMPDVNDPGAIVPAYELEYLTYPPKSLLPPSNSTSEDDFTPIVPLHLLPTCLRSPLSDGGDGGDENEQDGKAESSLTPKEARAKADKDHFAPYQMEDLTITSYVALARRLARDRRLWKRFMSAIYVGTGAESKD